MGRQGVFDLKKSIKFSAGFILGPARVGVLGQGCWACGPVCMDEDTFDKVP